MRDDIRQKRYPPSVDRRRYDERVSHTRTRPIPAVALDALVNLCREMSREEES